MDAENQLRRDAEIRGWKICCMGARRNAWASGMSRSMGRGIKAYLLEIGRHSSTDSLVNIFEDDAPENYGTVDDQFRFFDEWLISPKELKR